MITEPTKGCLILCMDMQIVLDFTCSHGHLYLLSSLFAWGSRKSKAYYKLIKQAYSSIPRKIQLHISSIYEFCSQATLDPLTKIFLRMKHILLDFSNPIFPV